jgi:hypothetical protein
MDGEMIMVVLEEKLSEPKKKKGMDIQNDKNYLSANMVRRKKNTHTVMYLCLRPPNVMKKSKIFKDSKLV